MKIRKRLMALIMAAVMMLGLLPMNVQAGEGQATNLYCLKEGDVCSLYDLDGDGKNDNIKYTKTNSYIYMYINNKKISIRKKFKSNPQLKLFNVENDRTYLLMSTFSTVCNRYRYVSTEAFYYKGNKLREITAITNYGKVRFSKMYPSIGTNGWLWMKTMNSERIDGRGLLVSFKETQEDVYMGVPFRFRNGTISINSDHVAIPGAQNTLRFKCTSGMFTSTSYNYYDGRGVALKPGDYLTVEDLHIGKNNIWCKIINDKNEVGWFNCSDARVKLKDVE